MTTTFRQESSTVQYAAHVRGEQTESLVDWLIRNGVPADRVAYYRDTEVNWKGERIPRQQPLADTTT